MADYNGIRDVSHSSGTHYIPFFERFRDQLDRSPTAKPFTRSPSLRYRDYLFVKWFCDAVSTRSQKNGWEFHIDGIHLNTRGGRILADVVQQFLDSPSPRAAGGLGSRS